MHYLCKNSYNGLKLYFKKWAWDLELYGLQKCNVIGSALELGTWRNKTNSYKRLKVKSSNLLTASFICLFPYSHSLETTDLSYQLISYVLLSPKRICLGTEGKALWPPSLLFFSSSQLISLLNLGSFSLVLLFISVAWLALLSYRPQCCPSSKSAPLS